MAINYDRFPGWSEAFRFLKRRFVRLYPLHLATFLISIVVLRYYPLRVDKGIISASANLLLLQSWFPQKEIHFAFNSVSWSISTLFFFYVAFTFIQTNFLRNFAITLLISLTTFILSIFYIYQNKSDPIQVHWLMQMVPLNRILVFLLGMMAAKIYLWGKHRTINTNIFLMSTLELLSVLLIVDRLSSCKVLHALLGLLHKLFGIAGQLTLRVADGYVLTPTLFVCLIMVFAAQRGVISRLLSIPPIVFLGKISFSIFLCHQLVYRTLSTLKIVPQIPMLWIVSAAFLITMVLSYFFILRSRKTFFKIL